MGASGSRRGAAVLQTVALALLVAAVVVGAGYAAQRVVLRSPTHGELLAAKVEAALLRYRYMTSVVHVAGEPTRRAECLEGWEPGKNGRPAGRGARVSFSDGERLILGDRRVARIVHAQNPTLLPPIAEVQLAGCPRSITNHIYGRLLGSPRTHAVAVRFAGRPALRLHVKTRRSVFDLFVDGRTLAPLGMQVVSRHVTGWSVVRPVKLTTARKQAFLERFDG
jgi:hypothetical protein